MKRILETFSDEEHQAMKQAKQKAADSMNKKSLTWHDYFLHLSGVNIFKANFFAKKEEKKGKRLEK